MAALRIAMRSVSRPYAARARSSTDPVKKPTVASHCIVCRRDFPIEPCVALSRPLCLDDLQKVRRVGFDHLDPSAGGDGEVAGINLELARR